MSGDRLKTIETHFAFGENWRAYAALIDPARIDEAESGLVRLIPAEQFRGRSFLDVGCGSGLHALAAARLGVSRVLAVDLDPVGVATAHAVLSANNAPAPWSAETLSVFDLDPRKQGTFDIVYAWGVLHHTGAMWEAMAKAAGMVAPNGLLAFALYRRTHLDLIWKIEKYIYAHAPHAVQRAIAACYVGAVRLAMLARGRSFRDHVANYKNSRGMSFYHDVHDWLGGYPYESVLPDEVEARLKPLGFAAERVFARSREPVVKFGCDEYLYRRTG